MSRLYVSPLAVALGLCLSALVPTAAVAEGTVIFNTFKVSYDLDVSSEHKYGVGSARFDDAVSFHVSGTVPDVDFSDARLVRASSSFNRQTVDGTMRGNTTNAEGTTISCAGGRVEVDGLAGIGQIFTSTGYNFWFGPWLSGKATGSCIDSDKKTFDDQRTVNALIPPGPDENVLPPGTAGFYVDLATLETGSWSGPFDMRLDGPECPDYTPGLTTSCFVRYEGTVRLTRVSREVRDSNDELLRPDPAPAPAPTPLAPAPKPAAPKGKAPAMLPFRAPRAPKLSWGAPKVRATTRVTCESACKATLSVGVEKTGKAKAKLVPVRPLRQRSIRLRGNTPTTISVPLSPKATRTARLAARRGTLMATLSIRIDGKHLVKQYRLR